MNCVIMNIVIVNRRVQINSFKMPYLVKKGLDALTPRWGIFYLEKAMNEINWQEVAEEVAGNLDYIMRDGEFEDVYYIGYTHMSIPFKFFSWKTFGLMVEKAEEMGWFLVCGKNGLAFIKDEPDAPAIISDFQTLEQGHIKACALAFNEIFRVGK